MTAAATTTARGVQAAEYGITRTCRWYVHARRGAEPSQREERLRQRVEAALGSPIASLARRRVPEDRGSALSIDPMLGVLGAMSATGRRRYCLGLLMRRAGVRDRMLKSAPWQERFAAVRTALREAELLKGRPRTDALVGVCRMMIDAEEDPPVPWEKKADGSEWRVFNASTRAYDRAEMRLELRVSRAVRGGCPCCYMEEHERRARPRRRAAGSSSPSRRS
jgi:hypothetical protein